MHGLFRRANNMRRRVFGKTVYIRGIIEFSNRCTRNCCYCGLRADNRSVKRYTMTEARILALARAMNGTAQTTIVLQSGEPPALGDHAMGRLIRRIKRETSLAVTLSCGCRPKKTLQYWRDCGLDRYLIRFETSNPKLYKQLHPDSSLDDRIKTIHNLKALGIQTGSGFLIGVPGENTGILADNIMLCRNLGLDMIGIGPFIAHPGTPLASAANAYAADPNMLFRALAVLRLFNPFAHIPATTAFDAFFPQKGRIMALQRGANIYMPNNTPEPYCYNYAIYPGKPRESFATQASSILALGLIMGKGPGHAQRPETHRKNQTPAKTNIAHSQHKRCTKKGQRPNLRA